MNKVKLGRLAEVIYKSIVSDNIGKGKKSNDRQEEALKREKNIQHVDADIRTCQIGEHYDNLFIRVYFTIRLYGTELVEFTIEVLTIDSNRPSEQRGRKEGY